MLQLTGDASWTAGERAARGQLLQYDRTNKIFSAHQDAFLRVPIAELGSKATPGAERGSPRSAKAPSRAGPTGATNAPAPPKYIEIASTDYTYTSNLLVFREQVRGTVLEENVTLATFSSAFLGLRFSNQLESAIATGKVFVDESPTFTSSSNWVARQFECEEFNARMGPGGAFDRVVALTNVVASQQEWRRGTNQPVRSRFSADQVTADFFPRTNAVRQAVAENNVVITESGGTARGDRAFFNGTNNIVELTGHPQVDFPERNIKVNEAEVLIWDRTRHEVFGKGMKGEGTISTNRPARPAHADGTHSTNRPANTPGLPIRPEPK
jgi:hypothetical protein